MNDHLVRFYAAEAILALEVIAADHSLVCAHCLTSDRICTILATFTAISSRRICCCMSSSTLQRFVNQSTSLVCRSQGIWLCPTSVRTCQQTLASFRSDSLALGLCQALKPENNYRVSGTAGTPGFQAPEVSLSATVPISQSASQPVNY